jgi:hypothetical protein
MEKFKNSLVHDVRQLYQWSRSMVSNYPVTCTMIGLGIFSLTTRQSSKFPLRTFMFSYNSANVESLITSFALFKQPILDTLSWYRYGRELEHHYVTIRGFLRQLTGNAFSCIVWLWILRGEFSRDPDLCWCLGSSLLYSQLIDYAIIHASSYFSICPGLRVKGIYAPWYLMVLHIVTGTWIEEYFLGMLAGVSYFTMKLLYRKWKNYSSNRSGSTSSIVR